MGGGRPTLLQRRVDALAHAAAAVHDRAGVTHGDCVGGQSVEAVGNLRRGLSKEFEERRQRPGHQRSGTQERCEFPPLDGAPTNQECMMWHLLGSWWPPTRPVI